MVNNNDENKKDEKINDFDTIFSHSCLTCSGLSIINGMYMKNFKCPHRYTFNHVMEQCPDWIYKNDT